MVFKGSITGKVTKGIAWQSSNGYGAEGYNKFFHTVVGSLELSEGKDCL